MADSDRPIASADNADRPILDSLLLRDRFVVIAGLLVVIAAAWTWILLGAGTGINASEGLSDMAGMSGMNGMPGMSGMAGMPSAAAPAVWTPPYAALMCFMWWVMMIAMMLPSAAPMLLLFARVNRKERSGGRPYVPTAVFAVISECLGGVQRRRHCASVVPGAHRSSLVDHGHEQFVVGRGDPCRGGRMAAHADQECLPSPLSLAVELPVAQLAARISRRIPNGFGTRRLLPRMLLVPDEPPILRRHHEPLLDHRPGDLDLE